MPSALPFPIYQDVRNYIGDPFDYGEAGDTSKFIDVPNSRVFTNEEIQDILKAWDANERIASITARHKTHLEAIRRLVEAHGRPRRRLRIGANNSQWQGGRHMRRGYIEVWCDRTGPFGAMAQRSDVANNRSGYVLEHRLVMAQHLGRPLESHEQVHHINGDKTDNRIENLQLRTTAHSNGICGVCLDCGSHRINYGPILDA